MFGFVVGCTPSVVTNKSSRRIVMQIWLMNSDLGSNDEGKMKREEGGVRGGRGERLVFLERNWYEKKIISLIYYAKQCHLFIKRNQWILLSQWDLSITGLNFHIRYRPWTTVWDYMFSSVDPSWADNYLYECCKYIVVLLDLVRHGYFVQPYGKTEGLYRKNAWLKRAHIFLN